MVKDSYSLPLHRWDIWMFRWGKDLYNDGSLLWLSPNFDGWGMCWIEITDFTTKLGSCQFKVIPFVLTGAPATFQRKMNRILFPI